MGIEPIYRRANTCRRHPRHAIYQYLLRNPTIDRPNEVWATDVTDVPIKCGFVYLVAIVDWFSSRVLNWRVSNSMTPVFRAGALEEAIARNLAPEIFNTDQGAQFAAASFVGVPQKCRIRISMEGGGAWRYNVFVERLWRSVKYEEVYLRVYDTVSDAKPASENIFFFFGRRLIRRLTAPHRIPSTSIRSCSRRLPNPRSATYPDREICLNGRDHLSI